MLAALAYVGGLQFNAPQFSGDVQLAEVVILQALQQGRQERILSEKAQSGIVKIETCQVSLTGF